MKEDFCPLRCPLRTNAAITFTIRCKVSGDKERNQLTVQQENPICPSAFGLERFSCVLYNIPRCLGNVQPTVNISGVCKMV